MFKSNPKSNKIRNILIAVLPGLVVFGFVYAANIYYDLDTLEAVLEHREGVYTTSTLSALTVTQRAGEGLCRRVVNVEVNYNQVGVVLPCQARALDRSAGGIRAHSSAS